MIHDNPFVLYFRLYSPFGVWQNAVTYFRSTTAMPQSPRRGMPEPAVEEAMRRRPSEVFVSDVFGSCLPLL